MPPVAAAILTGGLSRRFGRPKALLQCDGQTLIERTVRMARSLVPDVMLVGHAPFDLPSSLRSIPTIPDRPPGIGPLGGLSAALFARTDAGILLIACDMPYLQADLLGRLIAAASASTFCADAVVPHTPSDDRLHPCASLYLPTCSTTVAAQIHAGRHAMLDLLARVRVHRIDLAPTEAAWVQNVNSPADWHDGGPAAPTGG